MVYFLHSKVKTHAEEALQYIFDEHEEKNIILGYSMVLRRSPLLQREGEDSSVSPHGWIIKMLLARETLCFFLDR